MHILNNRCPLLYITLFWSVFCFSANGQASEDMLKAGYIEKFTHFVQWPSSLTEKKDRIDIAVIGENTIINSLSDVLSKANNSNATYNIIPISKIEQINDVRILFISGTEKNNLEKILEYTSGKPILTISDTRGFAEKGVIINLFKDGSYIRYEINRKSLDKSGLEINSMLLNYAVILSGDE